jgi:hypothetical protein
MLRNRVILLACILSDAVSLRVASNKAVTLASNSTLSKAAAPKATSAVPSAKAVVSVSKLDAPTPGDVDVERRKMERIASGLVGVLKAKDGPFTHSKVAPALKLFADNMNAVLKDVAKTKTPADAMRKLRKARDGAESLIIELTRQQISLMKEDVSQKESLLLGVLMSHQSDSMQHQFEILRSADFADLNVSQELLRTGSKKDSLYKQAAVYLDARREIGSKAVTVNAKIEAMAASLDKRVEALERESQLREKHFNKKMTKLSDLAKNASKVEHRQLQSFMHREKRKFNKWAAARKHDLASMKAAADAVRKGDAKALERARAALLRSLEALKSQSGGFLHLLQLGHTVLERDCPYCAAQCIEGCRQHGESYVSCLGTCEDAGKSF